MKVDEIRNVGIVGAGLMGHGIAQVFGVKGYRVRLFDKDPKVLESAPSRIRNNLQVFLDSGLVEMSDLENCLGHIELCRKIADLCDGVEVVIEAVSERLEVKRSVFADIEKHSSQYAVICSNTSGISIGKISEELQFKERVVGTHFWNPPHVLPCVEVIRSEYTSDETFETIFQLMKKVDKKPVRVLRDLPCFLGNRLQHALFREALALVDRGIAGPEDLDRVVKFGFGLRLPFIGPFETADLAGIDLAFDVQEYLLPDLCHDLAPAVILTEMIEEGRLGVKTKAGFYEWDDERIQRVRKRRDLRDVEVDPIDQVALNALESPFGSHLRVRLTKSGRFPSPFPALHGVAWRMLISVVA